MHPKVFSLSFLSKAVTTVWLSSSREASWEGEGKKSNQSKLKCKLKSFTLSDKQKRKFDESRTGEDEGSSHILLVGV